MMGSPEREHPATAALRGGSLADLQASLSADLARHADVGDDRDVMIDLTPYWTRRADWAEPRRTCSTRLRRRSTDRSRTWRGGSGGGRT